ncbi:MAG: FCD domain-containing protein, partial [Rhizobiaceae bacterium]
RAAQNNYFTTAMEALKDHIAVGMKFHGASIKREASGLSRVFGEHEAIATAIANSNEDDARRLMFEHLKGSRERLFQSSHL